MLSPFTVTAIIGGILVLTSGLAVVFDNSTRSALHGFVAAQTRAHVHDNTAISISELCAPCDWLATSGSFGSENVINMTTTTGFGRTGNVAAALINALVLGYECGAIVELPATDHYNAFHPEPSRFFDFRTRPQTNYTPWCTHRVSSGNAKAFWDIYSSHGFNRAPLSVLRCLRHYAGFCQRSYCESLDLHDTVVIHLRQGDAFKPNFSSRVHPASAQPPLSFYLSVMKSTKTKKALVLGEPSNKGPTWLALQLLQMFGVLKVEVELQSSSIYEDLRAMICAPIFVEARTSMVYMTRLGFAHSTFTTQCFHPMHAKHVVYKIPIHQSFFKYFKGHTNSPSQWVDTLLTQSFLPEPCLGRYAGWETKPTYT